MKRIVVLVGLFSSVLMSSVASAAKFPESNQMQDRLASVVSEERLNSQFYPILLAYAGQDKAPQEVVDIIHSSIDQFVEPLGQPGMVRAQLMAKSFLYIRSLFSDQPEQMAEALRIHQERWEAIAERM